MVLLALTLARDINPLLERIDLEDMSAFTCELPNNKEYKLPMKQFHIAFHGATWYEYYFDAKLNEKYDQDRYLKLKQNLYNPDKKPKYFDFKNEYLQEELEILYNNSKTWSEFFNAIDKKYKKKKCSVVYPWLISAMSVIFEKQNMFANVGWYIDLKENAAVKTAPIQFKSYDIKNGGKRQTRKRYRYKYSIPSFYYINIPEVGRMNYAKFLR